MHQKLHFSAFRIILLIGSFLSVVIQSTDEAIVEDGSENRGWNESEPFSENFKWKQTQSPNIPSKKRKSTIQFSMPIFWARFGMYPRNTTRALILAGAVGSMGTVVRCLENGADIDGRGRDGETPLIAAASAGQLAVASLLLASGADPRAVDCRGETALDKATERGGPTGPLLCMLLRRRLRELEPPLPLPAPLPVPPHRPDLPAAAGTALRMAAAAAGCLFLVWAVAAAHLFANGHFDPWLIEH
jgi:hypothetical protein